MAKKITLADIAKILKKDKTKGDTSYWGVVQSVNTTDGKVTSYNVSLGGDAGTVKCRKLAGAKVNDTVLVTLRSTGEAIVVGTKNGDTDASDAQTTANTAQGTANTAQGTANAAQQTANTAQQTANSASTTATNAYNKAAAVENHFWFEGTGSDVGAHISTDTTIGTTTLNTLINAGGMAVRKGTTILSKFTDSLIELGKNSTSAVIKMCGGIVQMRKDSYSNAFVVESKTSTSSQSKNGVWLIAQRETPEEVLTHTGSSVWCESYYNGGAMASISVQDSEDHAASIELSASPDINLAWVDITGDTDITGDLDVSGTITGTFGISDSFETVTASKTGISVTAGNQTTGSFTATKSGYKPVALGGFQLTNGNGSGASYGIVFQAYISSASSGSVTIGYGIRALGASQGGNVSNCTLNVPVTWVKI